MSNVEELNANTDYSSHGTDREMGGACSTYGGEKFLKGIGGEIEGKRPLERPSCRRENNIKMDLQKWDDT